MSPLLQISLAFAIGTIAVTCMAISYASITVADAMLERNRILKNRSTKK